MLLLLHLHLHALLLLVQLHLLHLLLPKSLLLQVPLLVLEMLHLVLLQELLGVLAVRQVSGRRNDLLERLRFQLLVRLHQQLLLHNVFIAHMLI